MAFDYRAILSDQWLTKVLSNRYAQLGVAVLVGALATVFLYPTKTIEQNVADEYQLIIDRKVKEQKDITTQVQKLLDEQTSKNSTLESQYRQLVTEFNSKITEMQSHRVETTHTITRPDGSSETWTSLETQDSMTEKIISELKSDYESKLKQSESDWSKKLETEVTKTSEQYKIQIAELQKELATHNESTVTTINAKKLGVEVGATSEFRGYVHATYDLWGPIFVGAHVEGNRTNTSAGGGLGIRF
jgi:hypothetical protein